MALFAGGYKNFGPTYNSTKYVRFGHEGTVNSMHFVDPKLVPADPANIDIDRTDAEGNLINGALAGKIAAYVTGEDGETYVGLCDVAKQPAGLIVDDLGDIANASNAYANGYIPCLMVMSSQIDDDIVIRYRQAKWVILQGYPHLSRYESTYSFFRDVIGFDFASFMSENQEFFKAEIHGVLNQLMRAE